MKKPAKAIAHEKRLDPALLVRAICISSGRAVTLWEAAEHSGLTEKEVLKAVSDGLQRGLLRVAG